ncbi:MAG: flagellar biosynthesis protein FlhB, partial [Rhodospirillaceae bacterium]|nr:flagellar biosynthesis protein FlhB [Rhodospirillaceae bacterium]
SQKTEEPTQKKLDDSRKKGQVATSREVSNWFMILAGTIIIAMISPSMSSGIKSVMIKFLAVPHAMPVEAGNLADIIGSVATDIGFIMIVPMLLLLVAAFASTMVQNGLVVAVDRIQPKLERASPMAGAKRLFSLKSLVEFAKGILKITIVGTVATMLMLPSFSGLEQLVTMEMGGAAEVLHSLVSKLLFGVLSVVTIIAAIDFLYQRFEHMKQMRMSRQEIKDEFKQSEGDPMVKARLRQVRQERARQRTVAAVPEASVVITNPTHFAVALKYDMDDMAAPVLLAKGQDFLALNIREVAAEHNIPIVENPPVARALYANVEVDEEIPQEQFKAVAEIIGYVFRLKGKLPPQSRP